MLKFGIVIVSIDDYLFNCHKNNYDLALRV